jgi:type IX secretion system PorP/SprF family membrane protein
LSFFFITSYGQQTPLNPISYWVFTPYIYNPAIIGSKDFLSVDLNSAFKGSSNTQLISVNTRFSKTRSGYFASPDILEFKNAGVGASVFHDINGPSRNIGISAGGSYQLPLNTSKLSYLSIGGSVKGVYNTLDTASGGSGNSLQKTFYSNLDLGIYFYSTTFYMGISATNLLDNPQQDDSLKIFKVPVTRQYFFIAGCKILLDRGMNIVLEPSVIINANDSTFNKISDNINPVIRLYVENFCIGTYFNSKGKTSFFAQFKYPRFYVGTFFEFPQKTAFYKGSPTVHFTVGINILADKSRLSGHTHW